MSDQPKEQRERVGPVYKLKPTKPMGASLVGGPQILIWGESVG